MKKTIFIINGSGSSGKDTVVSMFAEKLSVRNTDSVLPVKNAARVLGWDYGKSEEDRLFLSRLKELSDRHFNTSYTHVTKSINNFVQNNEEVMFIHIREPKNIENVLSYIEKLKLKHDVECYTLLVTNKNVEEITSNTSDASVHEYIYDYLIENDGTLDDLRIKVNELIKEIE